jgi:uncharacterized membrane protein
MGIGKTKKRGVATHFIKRGLWLMVSEVVCYQLAPVQSPLYYTIMFRLQVIYLLFGYWAFVWF